MIETAKPMKIPGPDHPITIMHNSNRVIVTFAGQVIADTREALTLKEASYPPVLYVPRSDVNTQLLQRTEHATYCPYKGDCSYFTIAADGRQAVNAAWSYESPHAAVASIAQHVAFYPDRVDAIEERPTT